MKLKDLMITELTTSEKDMKEFLKIKPELDQLLNNIEKLWDKIEDRISDANLPGAHNAFKNAIKATMGSISGRPRSKPGKEELKRYAREN